MARESLPTSLPLYWAIHLQVHVAGLKPERGPHVKWTSGILDEYDENVSLKQVCPCSRVLFLLLAHEEQPRATIMKISGSIGPASMICFNHIA